MKTKMKNYKGLTLIFMERIRQMKDEGWTLEHDDKHLKGELASAASAYTHPVYWEDGHIPMQWPWEDNFWKPSPEDRIKELVKAGALIVAEIERLQRKEAKDGK